MMNVQVDSNMALNLFIEIWMLAYCNKDALFLQILVPYKHRFKLRPIKRKELYYIYSWFVLVNS
jgi:hypothetical protein